MLSAAPAVSTVRRRDCAADLGGAAALPDRTDGQGNAAARPVSFTGFTRI